MKEEQMCQNCKSSFIIEDEDFQFYEKINVPPLALNGLSSANGTTVSEVLNICRET